MATETTLNTINIFSSLASYNSNLSAIGENEISLVAGAGVIVAQNLGENGYVKFSNGLILQWGKQVGRDSVVTLPLAYSKVHFTAYAICYGDNWAWMKNLTLTTLNPRGATACYWLSIGIQMQWGRIYLNMKEQKTLTFPVPFSTTNYSVSGQFERYTSTAVNYTDDCTVTFNAINKTSCTLYPYDAGDDRYRAYYCWMAIGY